MEVVKRDSNRMIKKGRKYKTSRTPLITPVQLVFDDYCVIEAIKTDEYVEMAFDIKEDINNIYDKLCELELSSDDNIFKYNREIY